MFMLGGLNALRFLYAFLLGVGYPRPVPQFFLDSLDPVFYFTLGQVLHPNRRFFALPLTPPTSTTFSVCGALRHFPIWRVFPPMDAAGVHYSPPLFFSAAVDSGAQFFLYIPEFPPKFPEFPKICGPASFFSPCFLYTLLAALSVGVPCGVLLIRTLFFYVTPDRPFCYLCPVFTYRNDIDFSPIVLLEKDLSCHSRFQVRVF